MTHAPAASVPLPLQCTLRPDEIFAVFRAFEAALQRLDEETCRLDCRARHELAEFIVDRAKHGEPDQALLSARALLHLWRTEMARPNEAVDAMPKEMRTGAWREP